MDQVTFEAIDNLVAKSQFPLEDVWLADYVSRYWDNIKQRLGYYRLLYHLVELLRPAVCLEIGVEFGAGSAHMARAAQPYGGQVIGVDVNHHDGPGLIIQEECRNYRFIQRPGGSLNPYVIKAVTDLCLSNGRIGLVFQDSSHHYLESTMEWMVYCHLLDEPALWLCDDITPAFYEDGVDWKPMTSYWKELPGQKRLYPEALHVGNTVGVMICGQ